ncbi:DUF2631 domain-containing protein [Nocardia asteroides]|uniref:DUF2631 domain-containing protein n=1 Tax=Nocardia asteroides NBRC 15531 TaxID=1110697 RepID=U5E4Z9_NOCAS|nr:DUF2631 domain-containing protein [Nocardia asteroides]TLF64631.1 DUF2631 domain-containing protein [Nocardia asteroides NBRC 15531]UGT50248.1 DUF2631 domain-containing protein [Nocardia asteroides]SFN14283.1 Protein of unknown function [Nocardia asteroides]VEG36975.1 Protein of uncharacterised function (DUF2631) [Nocardia asteroides]GAD81970.1 hypothetical protein NCAST_05_04070 [Nocardia asteroides NBRC 15531]
MAATDLESASTERAVATSVDPAEVPSAAWGWSGESRKTFRIAAWVVIVALLGMTIGNHQGHVEDIFLIGLAGIMATILIVDSLTRRIPK